VRLLKLMKVLSVSRTLAAGVKDYNYLMMHVTTFFLFHECRFITRVQAYRMKNDLSITE
jgi:hypothetical protein